MEIKTTMRTVPTTLTYLDKTKEIRELNLKIANATAEWGTVKATSINLAISCTTLQERKNELEKIINELEEIISNFLKESEKIVEVIRRSIHQSAETLGMIQSKIKDNTLIIEKMKETTKNSIVEIEKRTSEILKREEGYARKEKDLKIYVERLEKLYNTKINLI